MGQATFPAFPATCSSSADRKNFFGIARGGVQDCVPRLELAPHRKLLGPQRDGIVPERGLAPLSPLRAV